MAFKTAKTRWMEMPTEYFETLTFGQLKPGQHFIILPVPGDNNGHGGFKSTYHIFTKIYSDVTETASGVPYNIPHGRAANNYGASIDFPHSTPIIRVE